MVVAVVAVVVVVYDADLDKKQARIDTGLQCCTAVTDAQMHTRTHLHKHISLLSGVRACGHSTRVLRVCVTLRYEWYVKVYTRNYVFYTHFVQVHLCTRYIYMYEALCTSMERHIVRV